MTDIVERLRHPMITYHDRPTRNTKFYNDQRINAADEIERLRDENKTLIELVKDVVEDASEFETDWNQEARQVIAASYQPHQLSADTKKALKRIDKAMKIAQDTKSKTAAHIGDD